MVTPNEVATDDTILNTSFSISLQINCSKCDYIEYTLRTSQNIKKPPSLMTCGFFYALEVF